MLKLDTHKLCGAHDWTFPVPIAYGPGRLTELGIHCKRLNIFRPLLITDRGSASLPFVLRALSILRNAGLKPFLYSDIPSNPRDKDIQCASDCFRSRNHDGVIAIGGGSGMDGAKATALTVNSDYPLWNFDFELPSPELSRHVFPPLICIPTTAGTGAETESTAMITHTGRMMKLCVWHPALKPSLALLDPELTLDLPADLTAWTGIDALVHAIESYCVPSFHPICDGMALQALSQIGRGLITAVNEPHNIEARGAMQIGACLAGISFLKGLGLVHSISHMVGADYDTHHGLTNAIVLPSVLKFNAPVISGKLDSMANALGWKISDFSEFYLCVCQLLDRLEIPKNLSSLGVDPKASHILAEKALIDSATKTNPRLPALTELKNLIHESIVVGR